MTTTGVEFLARLFPSDALVELRAFRTDRNGPAIQFFARNGREITLRSNGNGNGNGREISAFLAEQIRKQNNIYFGCATRRILSSDEELCGDKKHCAEIVALWCEIDFKDVPEQEARRRLASFPLPPSIIIRSGGGLHCYWLLREPVAADASIEPILRGIASTLGADTACAEIARVLRVPGTVNFKYSPPCAVTIEREVPECIYNLAEFEVFSAEQSAGNSAGEFLGVRLPPSIDAEEALRILATKIRFNVRRVANGETWLDYHGIVGSNGRLQPCWLKGEVHQNHAGNPRQSSFVLKDDKVAHFCFHTDCRNFGQDGAGIRGLEQADASDFESKTRVAIRALGLAAEFLGEPRVVEASEPAAAPETPRATASTAKPAPKSDALPIEDLPQAALCGRLGEICEERLGKFPRSYAWVSLVTMAGALSDRYSDVRPNLYSALCGPVGSSKTESTKHAAAALGLGSPEVERTNAGSIEGLAAKMSDAAGSVRVYCPDEMVHLFEKAQIQHATFCPVLCRCFGETKFDLIVAGRKVIPFDCVLSILGGCILDDDGNGDNFHDCFGATSVGGLYDRFLFARCPRPFTYDYFSFTGGAENLRRFPRVGVDPQIWEMVKDWRRTVPGMTGRIGEIVLRVAAICCAANGETLLRPASKYTDAALALAKYQIEFRAAVKANPGENFDAKCATAIEARVRAAGKDGVPARTVYRAIHANRFGPNVFRRAAEALALNGEMERKVRQLPSGQKSEFWAWVTAW